LPEMLDLTPSQANFIKKCLPEFSKGKNTAELAGQAGSMRSFIRIRGSAGQSVVLVVWDGKDEDWPRYHSIPEELCSSVTFLPEIYGSDARHGLILEEDLGDVTLNRYSRKCVSTDIESAYRKVLDSLCVWQNIGREKSPTICARKMDIETFLWETDYFARRCVVDFCGCERVLDAEWEKERLLLAKNAAQLPQTFIHRDFQSENILLADKKIRYVDFQGARLGPPAYDVASLLFDPYMNMLDEAMVLRLFSYYQSLSLCVRSDGRALSLCAAQRLMQALGAYGNLSIHKGKTRYREFIPVALERLGRVVMKLPEFTATGRIVRECLRVLNTHCERGPRSSDAGSFNG
jgi:N-acetylmuramate 1-kinase